MLFLKRIFFFFCVYRAIAGSIAAMTAKARTRWSWKRRKRRPLPPRATTWFSSATGILQLSCKQEQQIFLFVLFSNCSSGASLELGRRELLHQIVAKGWNEFVVVFFFSHPVEKIGNFFSSSLLGSVFERVTILSFLLFFSFGLFSHFVLQDMET